MVSLNYEGMECCAKAECGDGFSIVICDMTESDKEYIKGLNINPTNYSFTWKKAVVYDECENIVEEWLVIDVPDAAVRTRYTRFVKE